MHVSNISAAVNKIDYWHPITTIGIQSNNDSRSLLVCLSIDLSGVQADDDDGQREHRHQRGVDALVSAGGRHAVLVNVAAGRFNWTWRKVIDNIEERKNSCVDLLGHPEWERTRKSFC